jgi:hypothetical protein
MEQNITYSKREDRDVQAPTRRRKRSSGLRRAGARIMVRAGVCTGARSVSGGMEWRDENVKRGARMGGYILSEDFVHLEHVNSVRVEQRTELCIAHDLALVARVLQLQRGDKYLITERREGTHLVALDVVP